MNTIELATQGEYEHVLEEYARDTLVLLAESEDDECKPFDDWEQLLPEQGRRTLH